ncbi:MAG: hypothetical protein KC519_17770 [Anaerolineae bacterium]|nr:hypothetical protein [Anaerolineae bacterium]
MFSKLDDFTWWRIARLLRARHRWTWSEFGRRHTTPAGVWLPYASNGVEYKRMAAIPVTR